MASYTHLGFRSQTGYVHRSNFLAGHGDYRGKVHALTGPERPYEGARYQALCGKSVVCDDDGAALCVWPADDSAGNGVTCRKCRKSV